MKPELTPEMARTIEARTRTLAPRAATIEHDPRATVEPETIGPQTAGEVRRRVAEALGQSRVLDGLDLERTLGEGGMGVVRLAEQVSLGRKVAVKTLREGVTDPGLAVKLLREAWVTGALEHPNVVPVYDLGVDADGRPVMVLRRIEGVHWGELMHDARALREKFGARDALDWNLRVLMQVCQAVRFAHARGIVHRDLKPENVMIGAFGEVYVVDWGLAVALNDDGAGRVPLARDATELAGTPAYMAPEMLGGTGTPIGMRTDVYLLGAVLFEIVTGQPPHTGDSLMALISSVVISTPRFPPGVPGELATLCKSALSREPDLRPAGAEQVRLALSDYLQHRGSMRLVQTALDALGRLSDELRSGETGEAHDQEVHRLFAECRFGFRAALAEWDGNEAARAGLGQAVTAMVEHELESGDARAASLLLKELAAAPAALSERVQAALEAASQAARRVEELKRLERSLDPLIGARTRAFVGGLLGLLWTVTPLFADRWEAASGGPSHRNAIAISLFFFVLAGGLAIWARDSMTKTLLNRRIMVTVLFAMLAQSLLELGAMAADIDPRRAHVLHFFAWFLITAMLAFNMELCLLVPAGGFLAAFFVTSFHPEWLFLCMSAANFLLTLTIVYVWYPRAAKSA